MKNRMFFVFCALSLIVMTACGGGGNSGSQPSNPNKPNLSISANPNNFELGLVESKKINVTIDGTSTKSFSVTVPQNCGTYDSLDSTSFYYTSPATIPVGGACDVVVRLVVDQSKTANVKVTVKGPLQKAGLEVIKHYSPPGIVSTEFGAVLKKETPDGIIVGVNSVLSGETNPRATLVVLDTNLNKVREWISPNLSSISGMDYDSAIDKLFVTGSKGQEALLLIASPGNLTSTDEVSFQVEGQKTEGRDVKVKDNKIYVVSHSEYQICWNQSTPFGDVRYCSNDFLEVRDMQGNLLKRAPASRQLLERTDYCSISINKIEVPNESEIWVSGNETCDNYVNSYQARLEAGSGSNYSIAYDVTGYRDTKIAWAGINYEANPLMIFGETYSNKLRVSANTSTYITSPILGPASWDGDNASGTNILNDILVAQASATTSGGMTTGTAQVLAAGSLSKIGNSNPSDTDGGIAAFQIGTNSGGVLWKHRFGALPDGQTIDSVDAMLFVGSGSNRKIVVIGTGKDGVSSQSHVVMGKSYGEYNGTTNPFD
jgi:hypothetical protein